MAKHKYPWMALSKLLNSKTELSTADFDGLADITASAAEVNVVDGVSAGAATASKALIVGSDLAISGLKRKVVAAPAGAVLTAAHSGNIYTNTGAGAAASWDLPAATAGLEYFFFVTAAQELRITRTRWKRSGCRRLARSRRGASTSPPTPPANTSISCASRRDSGKH